MFRRKSARMSTAAAAALLSMMMSVPMSITATAASKSPQTPSSNVELGRQYGDTIRARLYQHRDGTGYVIAVYGSKRCTTSTATADVRFSSMPSGWNDAVSFVADYNSCDVKLWEDNNFTGPSYGYHNFGSGKNLNDYWNDNTSSFEVS